MRKYVPRRAGMRWRESAPDYILDVFDNRGQSADRYTILLCGEHMVTDGTRAGTYIPYLALSGAPTSPHGVSMWGELLAHEAAGYRYRCKHFRIRWLDLPEHIRKHVVARAEEG